MPRTKKEAVADVIDSSVTSGTVTSDTVTSDNAQIDAPAATAAEENVSALNDPDEIEVVSLIPNVSYEDKKTGDVYEWNNVGDSEYMTFAALKEMRRTSKTYFNELWLKPMDSRVVKHFGLERVYKNYNMLMEEDSYTSDNITNTCKVISESPNGIKWTLLGRIRNLVERGVITDIKVLRALEKQFNVELLDLL